MSASYIHGTTLGKGTKFLFCEYLNSILLKIWHDLKINPLYRYGKHQKQDKNIESEKKHSRKHRLTAKHILDKNLHFIKPQVLTQLGKIIFSK